ncbi:hypothetical protein JR316_0004154 [Psilocybe cubensis]|uniref:Uncharacterized protein n=2 Tax=Psilocybe cubensis TaxID=181762 RepID=A0ACB8H4A3_PSICU|nr:hypothetical protein JR316_0004154 [Psilocybe cubensis]KAH9482059.1 hypothetical protein JR316_0004154 [Psilocybe cubensis]
MSILSNHVYTIVSRGQVNDNNVALDLLGGNSENGTQCQLWEDSTTKDVFNQQWIIQEVPGQPGTYTLRNLRSGTYLDLDNASKQNGAKIQGWANVVGTSYAKDQQWKFIANGPYFKIQNVGSQTFIDIFEKNYTPGTKVHGWQPYPTESQDWVIHRVSRTADEIKAILYKNPHIPPTCQTYLQDGLYVMVPKGARDEIYAKSGLKTTKWRNQIFDCDDFSFVTKAEVAKWGNSELKADGIAILWGVIFGSKGSIGHAYNFFLNDTMDAVVFFEPQNGEEYSDIGYQGYFSVF